MKIEYDKIEFDMNEFAPLLLQDKQEGFRRIGEMFLNAVLEKAPQGHFLRAVCCLCWRREESKK